MATKKGQSDELTQTAGVSDDAEKIEPGAVLAAAGPRDALVDPMPDDIIPDPEKGYHVGQVRQPAELVGVGGTPQGFRSIADEPSKFAKGSLAALKAFHNDQEEPDEPNMVGPDPAPAPVYVQVAPAAAPATSGTTGRTRNPSPVDVSGVDEG